MAEEKLIEQTAAGNSAEYEDFHETLGTIVKEGNGELVRVEPEELPRVFLKADGVEEEAVFDWEEKESATTQEAAEKLIAQQWEHYAPYFQDLAPEIPCTRTYKELKNFQWRIGTDADAADFIGVLDGKGDWEQVSIPHYGEPLGVAVTYYRTEFELTPEELEKESLWICFKGVDYKAQVFVNSAPVGSHEGVFSPFACEFTKQARPGKNVCVVMVENDYIPMGNSSEYRGVVHVGEKIFGQQGLGYDEPLVGWHHCPAGMGIWNDVYVEGRSDLFLQDIYVRPLEKDKAEVWVEVYATKVGLHKVALELSLYGQNFEETVFEGMRYEPETENFYWKEQIIPLPMEKSVNLLKIPVEIPNARLWEQDTPWLYQIQIRLLNEQGELVDVRKRHFGMRFFTMDTESLPKGTLRLNGKKMRLRGVGSQGREQWIVFHKQYDRLLKDYLLAKAANVNYLRISQRPVQEEVYDCCDKLGLLVQTDFPASNAIIRSKLAEALRQMQEMERLIRCHPSCFMITYINEACPNGQNRPHRCVTRPEMESFFRCADRIVHMLNPERVIKPIDGDYDPPTPYGLVDDHNYTCWYNGHGLPIGEMHRGYWMKVKPDWHYGCGEYGMEALDPISVVRKYYPKEWIPETDEEPWTPASMPGDPPPQLGHLHYFFYDTPKNLKEWVDASQTYQAQVMDLMTRAFRRMRRMNFYAYHFYMDAHPDGWLKAMADVEGTPKKAFWAYRDASAPVLMDLRYDRFKVSGGETLDIEVRVCNDIDAEIQGACIQYQAYLEDRLLFAGKCEAKVAACDISFQGFLPVQVPPVEKRSLLKVQAVLVGADGERIDAHELKLEVFPHSREQLGKVCLLGVPKILEKSLEQEFELVKVTPEEVNGDTAVLVYDPEQYKAREKELLSAVEQGANLLLFDLPVGVTKIAGSSIEVKKCGMDPVNFVARNGDHPLVADFKADDVRYWYDEEKGYGYPMLYTTFEAPEFESILTSANTGENYDNTDVGRWKKVHAVAEKKLGLGTVRIIQVQLHNRVVSNPVAKILLKRLIRER